jgi:hypothetical protein
MRFSEADDLEPFLKSSDPVIWFGGLSLVDRELEVEREREWFLSFFFTTLVSRFSLSVVSVTRLYPIGLKLLSCQCLPILTTDLDRLSSRGERFGRRGPASLERLFDLRRLPPALAARQAIPVQPRCRDHDVVQILRKFPGGPRKHSPAKSSTL